MNVSLLCLTSFMCGDQFDGGGHHRSCAAVPVQEQDPAGPWKGNRFNGTRASTGLTEEAVIRGFRQKVKQFVCMNTDLDGVCGLGGCSPVTVMEVKKLSSLT